MGAAPTHEGVQKFSELCETFLLKGSEVNIGALRGVCQYSIESGGVWLRVVDDSLVESFKVVARRFRKPGTLMQEVKNGKPTITFQIRRG